MRSGIWDKYTQNLWKYLHPCNKCVEINSSELQGKFWKVLGFTSSNFNSLIKWMLKVAKTGDGSGKEKGMPNWPYVSW